MAIITHVRQRRAAVRIRCAARGPVSQSADRPQPAPLPCRTEQAAAPGCSTVPVSALPIRPLCHPCFARPRPAAGHDAHAAAAAHVGAAARFAQLLSQVPCRTGEAAAEGAQSREIQLQRAVSGLGRGVRGERSARPVIGRDGWGMLCGKSAGACRPIMHLLARAHVAKGLAGPPARPPARSPGHCCSQPAPLPRLLAFS
jgi:hypothetical protein